MRQKESAICVFMLHVALASDGPWVDMEARDWIPNTRQSATDSDSLFQRDFNRRGRRAQAAPGPRESIAGNPRAQRISGDQRVLNLLSQIELIGLEETFLDVRNDLCARTEATLNGSLLLVDALAGLNLQAVYVRSDYEPAWQVGFDAGGEVVNGFVLELLQAVAAVGRFNYTIHVLPRNYSLTWSEELVRTLSSHDIILNYFTPTVERADLHFIQCFGFLMTSPTLVGKIKDMSRQFSLRQSFSWILPFEDNVWIVLIAACFVTGLAYLIVELQIKDSDDLGEGSLMVKALSAVYLSFLSVAGGGGFAPRTWQGKIILISWAWFILLIVSTYTANLASFLILQANAPSGFKDLHEAIVDDARICMQWGGSLADLVTARYPNYQNFIAAPDPYAAMANGECDAIMDADFVTDFAKVNRHSNPYCELETLGPPTAITFGGWMVRVNQDKCSGLIERVFQLISLQFEQTTDLPATIYNNALASATSQVCTSKSDDGPPQFSIYSMVGIYLVHGVLLVAGLVVRFFRRLPHQTRQYDAETEPRSDVKPKEQLAQDAADEGSRTQLLKHLQKALELAKLEAEQPQ